MSMATNQAEEMHLFGCGLLDEARDLLDRSRNLLSGDRNILKRVGNLFNRARNIFNRTKAVFNEAEDSLDEIKGFFDEAEDALNEAEDSINEAENSLNEAEGYCKEIKYLLDQIAKLNHETALLEASTEATEEQIAAYKQKFYAATEQAIIKSAELQLTPLQQPKQNSMSPLSDEHEKVMRHQAKCNESIEAESEFGSLVDNVDIPKVRSLNAQSYMQNLLENLKLDYLKIHSTCRDDIRKPDMACRGDIWKAGMGWISLYPNWVATYDLIMDMKVQCTDIRMQCDGLRKFYAVCLKAMDNLGCI